MKPKCARARHALPELRVQLRRVSSARCPFVRTVQLGLLPSDFRVRWHLMSKRWIGKEIMLRKDEYMRPTHRRGFILTSEPYPQE